MLGGNNAENMSCAYALMTSMHRVRRMALGIVSSDINQLQVNQPVGFPAEKLLRTVSLPWVFSTYLSDEDSC
jgi:hypothetical protein